ncbi:CsbD family protein [Actinoplanes sp. NPDC049668]|uniref:CsbD family protein n=1 Tax=unclassified Actinoplanes TaxID=2626549 RepID=UPI0033AC1E7B
MSNTDKLANKAEEAKGKVKEWVGDATDNESLQAEGVAEQAAANVKQAGEHAKDAGRDAVDALDDKTR